MGFIEALFEKFFSRKLPWLVIGIVLKYILDAMKGKPALADKAPAAPKPTAAAIETGKDLKDALRAGKPKFGIFVNSHSPTVAEQFAHAGYDWLLVDCQHGPMDSITMSAMLCAIQNGGAKSMVRVAGYDDRNGIQQALDLGADGILIPYINNAEEAAAGVSCCLYPFGKAGTRSVYFPQRSMNKKGLLGYAGANNDNVLIALQVETADCITNMEEICAVPRVDLLFLGQNDLCVSMGLFDGKYNFPDMYKSPELEEATNKLIKCATEKDILLGMFQFGTDRVSEFLDKGFNFISVGNDLHHCLTQNFAHKEALVEATSKAAGNKSWTPRHTNMPFGGEGALAGHNPGGAVPSTAVVETGKDLKDALRAGKPKFGIFVNSHSPTVAEQFAHAGYDWLLVDCQHGPMDSITMSAMLCAIQNGGAKSMVRVAGYDDRNGIQQALDLGADGILIPYINNAEEAAAGVSCCLYPFGKAGTRSVYFPQRSMNKKGLLGYAGANNDNVLIALQVETADCITNMEEICAVPRVDLLFLGQNDLCVSMGLFDGKYNFPDMYKSPELEEATNKLIKCATEKDILLGMFQFGTDRVSEFLDKGFNFISVGNDLHHCLTQNFAHKEALVAASSASNKPWTPRHTNMPFGGEGALAGHNPAP